ncbi:NigD-like protein [Phocaeicola sp.]
MKKLNLFLLAFLAVIGVTFQSCDDGDYYSIGDFAADWATVNVKGAHVYDFTGDRWGKLWPAATNYPGYSPIDGQRVIVYFNPLFDNYPEGYDCSIKVERIRGILTKNIEELTAENEEEFGNDPVSIYEGNMWISRGGYLNIIFNQNLSAKYKHRVSLVKNTTVTPEDDGYIHLEYRYNTYDDTIDRWVYGAVSFNLNSLDITSETKGIKVKINSATNGEKEITFDLKPSASPEKLSQFDFSQTEIR